MVPSVSRLAVVALAWAVAGCTYPAVREFADLASTASAEFELVTGDMQASQLRANGFLREAHGVEGDEVIGDAELDAVAQVQLVLQRYLEALATVASDELVSYDGALGGLGDDLDARGAVGRREADAYARLAAAAAEAITGWFRHRRLKDVMARSHDDVVVLTDFLALMARNYRGQLEDERRALQDLADEHGPSAETALHDADLTRRQQSAETLAELFEEIARRHEALAAHPGALDDEKVAEVVALFEQEAWPRLRKLRRDGAAARTPAVRAGRGR